MKRTTSTLDATVKQLSRPTMTTFLDAYSIKYWNGKLTFRCRVEASGFEYKGDGGLPRPTIRLPISTAT